MADVDGKRGSVVEQLQKSESDDATKESTPAKEPNGFRRLYAKSGLNAGLYIMMLKMALPPTIALAIYQDKGAAAVYSTLGYLPGIISILSFAIMPRSKFIQTMFMNIIGTCVGAAVALLQVYCSVQARKHTTPKPTGTSNGPSPGAKVSGYNSSASAVSAIWLFFNIYLVNTLRASRPQLQFPVIIYSIFANIAGIYSPSFPTMDAGVQFVERLLECFLTGFGIAAGVSLIIIPISVRMSWFGQAKSFIEAVQKALQAQVSYFRTLEQEDMFKTPNAEVAPKHHLFKKEPHLKSSTDAEMEKLKGILAGLGELLGKMYGDLNFAKREMAWGKLNAHEIEELFKLLQGLMLPLMGVASTVDIFQRLATKWGWREDPAEVGEERRAVSADVRKRWNEIMCTLHDPMAFGTAAISDGLQHALLTLQMIKPPKEKKKGKKSKKEKDGSPGPSEESKSDTAPSPGDPSFAKHLAEQIDQLRAGRRNVLVKACEEAKLDGPADEILAQVTLSNHVSTGNKKLDGEAARHQSIKVQIFITLYIDYLLHALGLAVLEVVKFADGKVEDGTLKKNRLITPGAKRLRKWFSSLLKNEDSTTEHAPDSLESGATLISSSDDWFGAAKDPEHLPPANVWQKATNGIRLIGKVLGSPASSFGFRVACATMSLAIIAFLEHTRTFFLDQRLVWAMIMVAIGMTLTAGSGVFGFIGRIAGTFVAMCTSFVIWYIANGVPAGVLIFLFVFIFFETYVILTLPKFTIIALLSIVTQVLIIGYELEVKRLGKKMVESNGQPAYPTYLLAPYRLATVVGGMVVAFFWTFFPYPLTSRSRLRKDLGHSLYLLANFHSIIFTTINLRARGIEGDLESKDSAGRKISKVRTDLYIKSLTLLGSIKQHSRDTVWEPTFGGKFPKAEYDGIIQETQNILNYLTLMSFASQTLSQPTSSSPTSPTSPSEGPSSNFLKSYLSTTESTANATTSTLTLLSGAVTNGHPLPPYLPVPNPNLRDRIEHLVPERLNAERLLGADGDRYAAFAVMLIAGSLAADDLGKLAKGVKGLVGEVGLGFEWREGSGKEGEEGKGKRE